MDTIITVINSGMQNAGKAKKTVNGSEVRSSNYFEACGSFFYFSDKDEVILVLLDANR